MLTEQDLKICELLLSTKAEDVALGRAMILSKFEIGSARSLCSMLVVCQALSEKYKRFQFDLDYRERSQSLQINLRIGQIPSHAEMQHYDWIDVTVIIHQLAGYFDHIRKGKRVNQVEAWLAKEVPRLFMRKLPEMFEGGRKERSIVNVHLNGKNLKSP